MARQITPAELTFHSFRHSQGDPGAQNYVLHYVSLLAGVEPSFELGDATLNKYLGLVHRPDSVGHVTIGETKEDAAEEILLTFRDTNKRFRDEKAELEEKSPDTQTTSRLLASLLVSNEIYYLGTTGFELDENGDADRTRQAQRVKEGRSSFLYYFGRDKHTTGFTELNRMYEDIWKSIDLVEQPEDKTPAEYRDAIQAHAQIVRDAELRHTGGLILGTPPSTPVQ